MRTQATQVLIAGAGPTGLVLAAELARRGITCRIVDKAAGPSTHSKALGVHARTLELLEKLDVADEMVARGRPLERGHLYAGGERLATVDTSPLREDTHYPFILSLPQNETERILLRRLAMLDLRVEWNTELQTATPRDDGITVLLQSTDGKKEHSEVPWLVGCDGARSTVRSLCGFDFEGSHYDEIFDLADLHIDGPLEAGCFNSFLGEDGICLAVPLPQAGQYRVVATENVQEQADPRPLDLALLQERFDRRAGEAAGMQLHLRDPIWMSRFKISRRLVKTFRRGRVLLAGDAAHIHSPVGGQGMNIAVHDAFNLGWKLALVLNGAAEEQLLESYDAERHPIARQVLRMTDLGTRAITLKHAWAQALRNRFLALMTSRDFTQRSFLRNAAELTMHYKGAASVGGAGLSGLPAPGERAPDALLSAGTPHRLYEHFRGAGFVLLLFTGFRDHARAAGMLPFAHELAIRFHPLASLCLVSTTPLASPPQNVTVLHDYTRQAHQRYAAHSPCLYLIRPDSHIGHCAAPPAPEDLSAHLEQMLRGH